MMMMTATTIRDAGDGDVDKKEETSNMEERKFKTVSTNFP